MFSLQIPDIPVVLGPVGTALAAIVIFSQTAMAFYSWRRSSAVDILRSELEISNKKIERLEKDFAELKAAEEKCQKQLERLTALYLEAKGQEEDDRKRDRERESK